MNTEVKQIVENIKFPVSVNGDCIVEADGETLFKIPHTGFLRKNLIALALNNLKPTEEWSKETLMMMEAYGDNPKDFPYQNLQLKEKGESEKQLSGDISAEEIQNLDAWLDDVIEILTAESVRYPKMLTADVIKLFRRMREKLQAASSRPYSKVSAEEIEQAAEEITSVIRKRFGFIYPSERFKKVTIKLVAEKLSWLLTTSNKEGGKR